MAFVALQTGELQHDEHFATEKGDLRSREEAAPAVLEGMKPDEPVFAALRLASGRRYSRFPVQYVGLREKSDTGKERHIWIKQL
jgi:hypothetical protein